MAVDSVGNVYIADTGDNAIKEWNPADEDAHHHGLVGTEVPRPAWRWTASGNVYIADSGDNAIKEWNRHYEDAQHLGLLGSE